MSGADSGAVTLANCHQEPIHIPGSIQPHGFLLVLDESHRLIGWSVNAPESMGCALELGMAAGDIPAPQPLKGELARLLVELPAEDGAPWNSSLACGGAPYDLVAHRYDGRILVELERVLQSPEQVTSFAVKAHRAIDSLRRQISIETLLSAAVASVAEVTGFDRVMAYRFRHDDSGDIMAERCVPELSPFLGMRYPASDIPAQARRLYTLNTLRLIADVNYKPVAVQGFFREQPLDLSHSVLRSVSPVHVEYLQNMGVQASMSISIVIEGRLWGLIACHHRQPMQVAYAVRMACDVLAQVLAARVQTLISQERTRQSHHAAAVRADLMAALTYESELLDGLMRRASQIAEWLKSDALIIAHGGRLAVHGRIPEELAQAIVDSLPADAQRIEHRHARDHWPESIRGQLGKWVGALALQIDPGSGGWIIGMRVEQIETIHWGGKPEKTYSVGPLGPRLTPRGSFELWRETVLGTAEPWNSAMLEDAELLLSDILVLSGARHAESDRARAQLLAVLGHDLRDPLHAINLATTLIESGGEGQHLTRIIRSSSDRMQKIIGQVQELSRITAGIGANPSLEPVDLSSLVQELTQEARSVNAAARYAVEIEPALTVKVDASRFGQALANLLSNARHHGTPAGEIGVQLRRQGGEILFTVSNAAEPIPERLLTQLFKPFKSAATRTSARPGSLGLGLFIAHEITQAHGGRIDYAYRQGRVEFSIVIPA